MFTCVCLYVCADVHINTSVSVRVHFIIIIITVDAILYEHFRHALSRRTVVSRGQGK